MYMDDYFIQSVLCEVNSYSVHVNKLFKYCIYPVQHRNNPVCLNFSRQTSDDHHRVHGERLPGLLPQGWYLCFQWSTRGSCFVLLLISCPSWLLLYFTFHCISLRLVFHQTAQTLACVFFSPPGWRMSLLINHVQWKHVCKLDVSFSATLTKALI